MAAPEARTWIVRGALLADPAQRRALPADILVTDGVIAAIGAPGMAAADHAALLDAANLLLHPRLINAHMHSHGGVGRGQGDKWTLELLLAAAPWLGGNRALADKRLSATICAAEMVLKGCTAAYDLFSEVPLPTRDGMDAAAEAYATVGMRAVIAPMVADLSFYQAIPGLLDALPDELRRAADSLRPGDGAACLAAIADIARIGVGNPQAFTWASRLPSHITAPRPLCAAVPRSPAPTTCVCIPMSARARSRPWPACACTAAHCCNRWIIGVQSAPISLQRTASGWMTRTCGWWRRKAPAWRTIRAAICGCATGCSRCAALSILA